MYQFGSYSDQMKLNAESVICLVICTTPFFKESGQFSSLNKWHPLLPFFGTGYGSRRSNQSMLEEINPEYTVDMNLSQFRETVEDR